MQRGEWIGTLVAASTVMATMMPAWAATPALPAGSRIVSNLTYVASGIETQQLDLYLPPDPGHPVPLIIWIHGGGWSGGSKKSCPPATWLHGSYAFASIGYRLSKEAIFPAQIHDCKAAVRFLRAHATEFNLDPQRFGVWGHSAGAHLAALLGVSGGAQDLEGDGGNPEQSSRVQCVVDYAGPSDLTTIIDQCQAEKLPMTGAMQGCVRHLLDGTAAQKPELARRASPVTYVTKEAAPVLIIRGEKDEYVPAAQSRELDAALRTAGVESALVILEGSGHWIGPHEPAAGAAMVDHVQSFFDRHLQPGGPAALKAGATAGGQTQKLALDPAATRISEPAFNTQKHVWNYKVSSPYLTGENDIEVLLPDRFDQAQRYRVLYALPVETGIGGHFGDSLEELRKADVHNRYGLICVAMAFDTTPWFGAHATNPQIRHEDYIVKVVVPLIESRYPTLGSRDGRLLLGFSKSGWGAFSLILRNAAFFGYACSWDAPLMANWPGGWGIKAHFGTQENFERYQISKLLAEQAALFRDRARLALLGETLFGAGGCPDKRGHTVLAHETMLSLGIRHAYRDDLRFTHSWMSKGGPDQGWLKPAVAQLMELVNAPTQPGPAVPPGCTQ